jgi:hypothetical protein
MQRELSWLLRSFKLINHRNDGRNEDGVHVLNGAVFPLLCRYRTEEYLMRRARSYCITLFLFHCRYNASPRSHNLHGCVEQPSEVPITPQS